MAKRRRPYELQLSESPKTRIAQVNARARSGELRPLRKESAPRKVVPVHQLAARQQAQDIRRFFTELSS